MPKTEGDSVERTLNLQIPEKLTFLLTKKARYKVAWGGRGGYKTWSFEIAIIGLCMERKIRVLCCRETQTSIEDSVYQGFIDQIDRLDIKNEWNVTKTEIRNLKTGSTIIFDGIQDGRIDMKGKEGIDICWIEEAEKLSKKSWDILAPTIRKDGSEIWISFNTTSEDAFVYTKFVVNTPDDCICVRTYWYENPFMSETLKKEALQCKKDDPTGYKHIWLGEPGDYGLRVYPKFKEEVHVKAFDFRDLVNRGNFFVGMDPHKTYFPAVVFGCKIPVTSNGSDFIYVIYNEWPTPPDQGNKLYYEVRKTMKCSHTQKQMAGIFNVLERTIGNCQVQNIDVRVRACDPYFAKGVAGSDWSSNTDGLVIEWARPENGGILWTLPEARVLSVQRNTINELLEYNEQIPVSALNTPSFYVMPHCRNTIATLKYHRDSAEKDIESETHKDFSDAMRILFSVMVNTPYRDKKKDDDFIRNMKPVSMVNKSLFFQSTVGIQ